MSNESGTVANVIDVKIKQADRWLINYGYDPECDLLLWHEIRSMTEAARDALGKRFAERGVQYDMINLSSIERGEAFTIDEYLAESGDPNQ